MAANHEDAEAAGLRENTDKAGGPFAGKQLTKAEKRLMAPAGCRAYMRRTLATEFPAIVQGFVKAAKTGSCPHVKLATELLRPIRKGTPRKKSTGTRLIALLEKERLERERVEHK